VFKQLRQLLSLSKIRTDETGPSRKLKLRWRWSLQRGNRKGTQ